MHYFGELHIPELQIWQNNWHKYQWWRLSLVSPLTTVHSAVCVWVTSILCGWQNYNRKFILFFLPPCCPGHLPVGGWYMIYKLFVVAWSVGAELGEKLTPPGLKQTDCWCNDVEHSQHVLHDLPFCCGHTSTHAFGGRVSLYFFFCQTKLVCWSMRTRLKFLLFLQKNYFLYIKTFSELCKLSASETAGAWRKLHNADLRKLYSSLKRVTVIKWRRAKWAAQSDIGKIKIYIGALGWKP